MKQQLLLALSVVGLSLTIECSTSYTYNFTDKTPFLETLTSPLAQEAKASYEDGNLYPSSTKTHLNRGFRIGKRISEVVLAVAACVSTPFVSRNLSAKIPALDKNNFIFLGAGLALSSLCAKAIHTLIWQGKTFKNPEEAEFIDQVNFLIKMINKYNSRENQMATARTEDQTNSRLEIIELINKCSAHTYAFAPSNIPAITKAQTSLQNIKNQFQEYKRSYSEYNIDNIYNGFIGLAFLSRLF